MMVMRCGSIGVDQPNGFPHWERRPYSLVVSQDEVERFLITSYAGYVRVNCQEDDCPVCQGYLACWWDLYNALPRARKLALARRMMEHGHQLPEAPWEDMA